MSERPEHEYENGYCKRCRFVEGVRDQCVRCTRCCDLGRHMLESVDEQGNRTAVIVRCECVGGKYV